jgi:Fe-S cluster assembly ATPase SufC
MRKILFGLFFFLFMVVFPQQTYSQIESSGILSDSLMQQVLTKTLSRQKNYFTYKSKFSFSAASGFSGSNLKGAEIIKNIIQKPHKWVLDENLKKEIYSLKSFQMNNNQMNNMGGIGVPLIFNRPHNGGFPIYDNR